MTTRLDEGILTIEMRHYDHQQETVSFYGLVVGDEDLSDDLTRVFGTTARLYETCFAKKENYEL